MSATLESPKPVSTSPTDAIANLIKGNRELLEKEKAAAPPAPEAQLKPEETPKPSSEVKLTPETPTKLDADFDFENPDPAKPPRNKKHWDGFLAAREQGFKKRDEEAANVRKELETVKQQIAEAQKLASTPRNDAEIEALKKDKEELNTQLYNIARERNVAATYEAQISPKLKLVEKIVGGEEGAKIVRLLKSSDSEYRNKELPELLDSLSPLVLARVGPVLNTLDELQEARDRELVTAKEEVTRWVQEGETKAKTEKETSAKTQRAQIDKLIETHLGKRKISNQERIATARQILYGEVPPDRVVEAILNDAEYTDVVNERDATKKERDEAKSEIEKLTAQIDSLTKASPALKQPSSKIPGDMKQPIDSKTSPQGAYKAYVQSIKND